MTPADREAEVTLEEIAPIPGQLTVEDMLDPRKIWVEPDPNVYADDLEGLELTAESQGSDPEDVSTTKEKESSGGRRSS